MKAFVTPEGDIRAVYSDELVDLQLGTMEVKRASEVEFNHAQGVWEARDTNGQLLATGRKRAEALANEVKAVEQQLRNSI